MMILLLFSRHKEPSVFSKKNKQTTTTNYNKHTRHTGSVFGNAKHRGSASFFPGTEAGISDFSRIIYHKNMNY